VDRDGLLNELEEEVGTSPEVLDSSGNRISDDREEGADGRTLEAVQAGDNGATTSPSTGGPPDGACGAFGLEALILLGLLGVAKKRRP